MGQRIAYDTREWTALTMRATFVGEGMVADPPNPPTIVGPEHFPLPANFKRLLLNSNVYRSTSALQPMMFIADADEWLQRRLLGYYSPWGEWMILGNDIYIQPIMAAHTSAPWRNSHTYKVGDLAVDMDVGTVPQQLVWQNAVLHTTSASGTFASERLNNPSFWTQPPQDIDAIKATLFYLQKNCVNMSSGGMSDTFTNDNDAFVLDERLLKLGMTWQWKANKGSPYAEDMQTYADALSVAAGSDKPAPIIVGRLPSSMSVRTAYPFPLPTPGGP